MENIKIPADSMLSREPACSDSSLATRIHLILQNQEALLVPNPDPVWSETRPHQASLGPGPQRRSPVRLRISGGKLLEAGRSEAKLFGNTSHCVYFYKPDDSAHWSLSLK